MFLRKAEKEVREGIPLRKLYEHLGHLNVLFTNKKLSLEEANRELAKLYRVGGVGNYYFFVKEVLSRAMENGGSDIHPRIHTQFCDACTQRPFGQNEVLILSPRGSLKSTVVTEGYPMWRFICLLDEAEKQPTKQFELSILITSHSRDNSKKFLFNIKKHFARNDIFIDCFGDWIPKNARDPNSEESWTTETIKIVQKNIVFTIETGSVRNALEGGHYNIVISDDLHNKDNCKTRAEIEKVIQYTNEIVPLGKHGSGTDFIFIGTRWAEYDAYDHLMNKWGFSEKKGNLIVFKAIKEDGSLWFPEFLSQEVLDKERRRMSPYFFSAQYLNDPVPPEDQYFKGEWLEHIFIDQQFWKKAKAEASFNGFMIVDPGGPHEGTDKTGIVVAQVDQRNRAFIVEAIAGNWHDHEIVERIFALANQFGVVRVGIEEVALARRLVRDIELKLQAGEGRFELVPVKYAGRTKEQRIMGLQPEMVTDRLFIGKWCTDWLRLYEELQKFRLGREMAHDDLADAAAFLKDIIFPAQHYGKKEKAWDKYKDDPDKIYHYRFWDRLSRMFDKKPKGSPVWA